MGDVAEQSIGNAKANFSSCKAGPADYSCSKKERPKAGKVTGQNHTF
jgi:hypothetical protein